MAYNAALTAKIREALITTLPIEEKKMFRGVAFMVDGKLCISAGDNEIMVRIDPELYSQVLKKDGCRPVLMRGKEYKGYVYVNDDYLQTKKELDYWISLALDFNKRAKASKKK